MESMREWLSNLLESYPHQQTVNLEEIVHRIETAAVRVHAQLMDGRLRVGKKVKPTKGSKHQSQMQDLQQQMKMNEEELKKAKREAVLQRQAQNEKRRKEHQQRSKEMQEQVQQWSKLQKQIKKRQNEMEKVEAKKFEEEDEKIKKLQEKKLEELTLKKKQQIEESLRKIEQNKERREELQKISQSRIQQLHPKYIDMEKKFKEFEEEVKFEENLLKKSHKLQNKIDHQAIKAHQQTYLEKVEARKERQKSHSPLNNQHQFTQFTARDEARIAEEKQKFKRRQAFEKRLKEIPVEIDEAKKVKIEIALDKGKNPFKYNFLRQKALNQFQIYGEFKEFEMNVNGKDLGKQYLRGLPQITKNSRVMGKSHSTNALSSKEEKIKYKDYLHQLRQDRPQRPKRGKTLSQLPQSSRSYQLSALRRKEQALKMDGMSGRIKASKEADDLYMKSIEAKLSYLDPV